MYFETEGPTRYLIILTPRLYEMIAVLHTVPFHQHAEVLRRFDSEIVSQP